MKQISRFPPVTRAFRDLKGKRMNEISVEEYDSLVDAAFMLGMVILAMSGFRA